MKNVSPDDSFHFLSRRVAKFMIPLIRLSERTNNQERLNLDNSFVFDLLFVICQDLLL